mgnify:CR=1 FL=1
MQVGSLVKYTRPNPADAHLVFEVAKLMSDEEGDWVLLVEGENGGFGCWEKATEFIVI